jgi:HK97 family phage major capsid protein
MKVSELVKAFEELKSTVERLSVDRAADSARAANESAKRVLGHIKDAPEQPDQQLSEELRSRGKGLVFARIVRAYGYALGVMRNGTEQHIPNVLNDVYRDRPLAAAVEKSLSTMVAEEGGLWVMPVFANDFIGYLRPKIVLFQLGARPYPMPGGTVPIPTLDAGTAGYWVGEVQGPKPSRPKTGQRVLREKFAGGKVVMSNNLLKEASVEADSIMLEDLTYTIKLQVEGAAFNGKGTEHTPKGLAFLARQVALNKLATDVGSQIIPSLRRTLIKNNVPMVRPGICFNADIEFLFYTAQDNQGRYLFKDEMDKGTLFKMPYAVSNLLETGSDGHGKSDIYCGDWNEFMIGDRGAIEVAVSREAMYTDEAGNPQSALENRETIIIAHLPTDFALRHEESMLRVPDAWTK